ncbi:hypothetical protein CF319_g639 [Tilletia indica]|nr:hypothetical protein CF319_g639 [Tilletia indica]
MVTRKKTSTAPKPKPNKPKPKPKSTPRKAPSRQRKKPTPPAATAQTVNPFDDGCGWDVHDIIDTRIHPNTKKKQGFVIWKCTWIDIDDFGDVEKARFDCEFIQANKAYLAQQLGCTVGDISIGPHGVEVPPPFRPVLQNYVEQGRHPVPPPHQYQPPQSPGPSVATERSPSPFPQQRFVPFVPDPPVQPLPPAVRPRRTYNRSSNALSKRLNSVRDPMRRAGIVAGIKIKVEIEDGALPNRSHHQGRNHVLQQQQRQQTRPLPAPQHLPLPPPQLPQRHRHPSQQPSNPHLPQTQLPHPHLLQQQRAEYAPPHQLQPRGPQQHQHSQQQQRAQLHNLLLPPQQLPPHLPQQPQQLQQHHRHLPLPPQHLLLQRQQQQQRPQHLPFSPAAGSPRPQPPIPPTTLPFPSPAVAASAPHRPQQQTFTLPHHVRPHQIPQLPLQHSHLLPPQAQTPRLPPSQNHNLRPQQEALSQPIHLPPQEIELLIPHEQRRISLQQQQAREQAADTFPHTQSIHSARFRQQLAIDMLRALDQERTLH